MARDTRGPLPPETSGLYRVSLNPSHWRQVRRLLAVEAVACGLLGLLGFVGILIRGRARVFCPLGLPLTPGLSAVLLGLAAASALAMITRTAAKVFLVVVSSAAVALVIGCGVAAAHQRPGPLGFTAAAIVWWAVVFCYNLGLGIWVIPDHIEGRAWVRRRRAPERSTTPPDRCDAR